MTISVVSSTIAAANTLTSGSHAAGDLIVAWAYRPSPTPPTLPSDWELLQGYATANNIGRYLATRVATSNSETFGTWTNATLVGCTVLRSDIGHVGPGASGQFGSNSLTVAYSGIYIRNSSNRAFVYTVYLNLTTNVESPPSGFSLLDTTNDGTREVAQFISNLPATPGFQSNQTLTGTLAAYGTAWVELYETASSGGGSTLIVIED